MVKNASSPLENLENAWRVRESLGLLDLKYPRRVFHGPGEGTSAFEHTLLIDRFLDYYWITARDAELRQSEINQVLKFLKSKNAKAIFLMQRALGQKELSLHVLHGSEPEGDIIVPEGDLKFIIRFKGVHHPGLFLDHEPLRRWLVSCSKNKKVLNTFAYTGSLSVAAKRGGASHVTSLDLSNPAIEWAKNNWQLNGFFEEDATWIVDDYFDRMKRFKKKDEKFDCIILDPPSFSRSKKQTFSTKKDLPLLFSLALDCLESGGVLVASINSLDVSHIKILNDLKDASQKTKSQLKILKRIEQPESFLTPLADESLRYLKGFIVLKG